MLKRHKIIRVNKLYRKYKIDFWAELILKGKPNNVFRFLLKVFMLKIKKLYFKRGVKKTKFIRRSFLRVLNKKLFMSSLLTKQHINLPEYADDIKRFRLEVKPEDTKYINDPSKEINYTGSASNTVSKYRGNFLGRARADYFKNLFWFAFREMFFTKKVKKKLSLERYLSIIKYSDKNIFFRTRKLEKRLKEIESNDNWKKKKKKNFMKNSI